MRSVRYMESFDGTRIAYSVTGDGPPVVLVPSWLTHLHSQEQSVAWRPWLQVLSTRYRLIRYDPRGCGLSDRNIAGLSFGAWVRDLEALVGELRLDRFSLIGVSQGGAVALDYTARNPGGVGALVLFGAYARGRNMRGDLSSEPGRLEVMRKLIRSGWGDENHAFATAFVGQFQPEAGNANLAAWCALQRMAVSPEQALHLIEIMYRIDILSAASVVTCPTLVAHATRDGVVPEAEGRLVAHTIPRARFLSLDSANHFLLPDEPAWAEFVAELHDFLPAPAREYGPLATLTRRERDVLDGLASGQDNREIAVALGLSEKTVRNHVSSIFGKLGIHSRAKVVVAARESGYGRGRPERL